MADECGSHGFSRPFQANIESIQSGGKAEVFKDWKEHLLSPIRHRSNTGTQPSLIDDAGAIK